MSSPAAYTALRDYLVTNWTTTPLVFENEDWPLDQGEIAAFIFVEIVGNLYAQASVGAPGDNLWRETGTMQCHVFVPNSTGTLTARQHAYTLAGLFREVQVDGITFEDLSLGASEPGRQDGNYFPFSLTVDWRRDEN